MKHRPALCLVAAALLTACATPGEPRCAAGSNPVVQDWLYMGLLIPSGGTVSEAEWSAFMKDTVTPRFPDGLTVLRAQGQWRGKDGKIVEEPSRALFLMHPGDARSDALVAEIAAAYKSRFAQEAVLRVRTPGCASF